MTNSDPRLSAESARPRLLAVGGAGLALAAAAALIGSSEMRMRSAPAFPMMPDTEGGRRGFQQRKSIQRWRNDGVRANKTYRLKGVRP